MESYLPKHDMDPALVAASLEDVAFRKWMDAAMRTEATRLMSLARTGHCERSRLVQQVVDKASMEEAQGELDLALRRRVYRDPNLASYQTLWSRLRRMADTIASQESVRELLERIKQNPQNALAMESTWQASVASVCGDISYSGPAAHLRDALGMAVLSLERIRFGVRLALTAMTLNANNNLLAKPIRCLLQLPTKNAIEDDMRELDRCFQLESGVRRAMLYRLSLLDEYGADMFHTVTQCFEHQVNRWRQAEDAKLWEIDRAESLYTYGNEHFEDETPEEAEERDFRETFGIDNEQIKALTDNHADDKKREQQPLLPLKRAQKAHRTDTLELWSLFRRSIGANGQTQQRSKSMQCRAKYIEIALHAAKSLLDKNPLLSFSTFVEEHGTLTAYSATIAYLQSSGK